MLAAHTCREVGSREVQPAAAAVNPLALRLCESGSFFPFGTEPFAVRNGAGYTSKVHMGCNLFQDSPMARRVNCACANSQV